MPPGWSAYDSQTFLVRVIYPSDWKRVGESDLRLEGPDGYVGLGAAGANPPAPLGEFCQNQAHHKLLPYGTQPQVTELSVAGQPACLITPSDDQDPTMHNLATVIVSYPRPIDRGGGVVDQFLTVDADKGHIRQIADQLSFLPMGAPVSGRVAVAGQDGQIRLTDLNVPVSDGLPGFPPRGGVAGDTVFALVSGNDTHAIRASAGGRVPLSFVQYPNGGFGVWTANQGQVVRLGWSTTHDGLSQVLVSGADGSDAIAVHAQPLTPERHSQLVFARWSRNGQSLYFSEEPFGLGGYILFAGASSLYRLNLADRSVQTLVAFNPAGGPYICWDDLSLDERLAAGRCDGKRISVLDLATGQASTIQPPPDAGDFGQIGGAHFSPDGSRLAFAFARGDPNNEQGWVAVSDGLTGGSHIVATSGPGSYFSAVAWLNAGVLLLQSSGMVCAPNCPSEVWRVNVDGSELAKVADGVFVALARHAP